MSAPSLLPLRAASLVALCVLLPACAEGPSSSSSSGTPASLAPTRSRDLRAIAVAVPDGVHSAASREPEPETHARRRFTVTVDSPRGALVVTDAALELSALDARHIAWIDESGLHLHVGGERRFAGPAAPLGLAVSAAGVLHATRAKSGEGTGLGLAKWDGSVRVLLPAPEELPGPSGYFHPIFSPDGKAAFVRSSLTPRPSVVRVELQSGTHATLATDVPSAASEWSFVDGQLAWISGEGEQIRLHPDTGVVAVLR